MKLDEIITRRNLASLAGSRSFSRGEDYFESGLVGPVTEKNGAISANVRGMHTYETRLKAVTLPEGKERLHYSCTCPVGRDGDFCKHCVALGLAWIAESAHIADEETTARSSSRRSSSSLREVTMKDIRTWLEGQDTKFLIGMLMEQIKSNGQLREELALKIAKESAQGIDIEAYRKNVRAAFHTPGHIGYHDMYEYAEGVNRAIDSIEQLYNEEFAEEALILCEYALEQASLAVLSVDDSAGFFSEFRERLESIHLAACKAIKPDPVELAKRLFAFEMMDSDLDIFYGAAQNYKAVLGKAGLAEYRCLAGKEWATVPEKRPGSRDTGYSGKHFHITSIMESLARADGDVDAVIEVKKRDLSHSYAFLSIAEIYKEAGRNDDALAWAEKGLTSFSKDPDNRLRDFVAEEYHRRKRYDEAYELYRIQFIEHPGLEQYKKVMEYAKKINRAEPAREDALSFLRQVIGKEKKKPKTRYWFGKPDHSRFVEIFLWEKDAVAAWAEANTGGCNDRLWLELAKTREKEHPADAVEVYKRLVEPVIEQKNNYAYEEAYRMIIKIRELMERMGQSGEFLTYLADLRLRHKPKRNMMKLLAGL